MSLDALNAVAHFSCGATSAIATAIALKKYKNVEIIYADTGAEHEDNKRFLLDCEKRLFKQKIKILKCREYENLYDLLEKRRLISFKGGGAICTHVLKKQAIREYLKDRLISEDQVFGYDNGELNRINRFKENNPEISLSLPLFDLNLSKANCLALLQRLNIKIPAMYEMGYQHSNCIGCVKAANLHYWAAIREDFPDVFNWMAKHERKIGRLVNGKPRGAAINKIYINRERKRVYLDELPKSIKPKRDLEISCGYSCGNVAEILNAKRIDPKIIKNEIDHVFEWLSK